MRSMLRSRRGSSSVFLCVILSSLVMICFAFIYSASAFSAADRADALMRLSCQSILSEYDRTLLEEYGLFALHESDRDLSAKLRHYLLFTFGEEPSVSVSDISASGASFAVLDPEPIRQQILAYMKAGGALQLRRTEAGSGEGMPDSGGGNEADLSGAGGGGSPLPGAGETAGRALRHGPTIASLPSRQLPEQDLLSRAEGFGDQLIRLTGSPGGISGLFADGTDRYLLSSYTLGIFNHTRHTADPDHFFLREVEYLLHGQLTDSDNLRKTESTLKMLRLSPNLAHIYSDPKKQEALAAAAEVISPGPGAILAQAALAAAWAYAESANDAKLLVQGFQVPLGKDDSSWAISLSHVLEDAGSGDGLIHPDRNQGLTYEQYLRILLLLEDETLLCSRIMDLIQINMRKNEDGEFLIGECCTGIAARAVIGGQEYSYESIYQRLLYR